ncbi:hypothetical protein [Streptomyces sp. NPDC047097]|uniref:hypothetical protein n=1 Tax=Streptomyces sp. NPDC047097 TaxID=3155260 RepID=UPI0033CC3D9C
MRNPSLSPTASPPAPGAAADSRAAETIKVFVLAGFAAETSFLVLGLVLFPDHGPLLWRVVWTLGLCGVGMGAAVGALTFLVTGRLAPGSRPALLVTAVSAAALYSVCQTLCWSLDHNVGLNYWGSVDQPVLFLVKGYVAAVLGGIVGALQLHTAAGRALTRRVGVFR